jgi:hypothetical protein
LSSSQPSVSIVVPVRNEADNIAPLIKEIGAAILRYLDRRPRLDRGGAFHARCVPVIL